MSPLVFRYTIRIMKAALGRVITKLVLESGVVHSDYESTYACHAKNIYGTANATITLAGEMIVFMCLC